MEYVDINEFLMEILGDLAKVYTFEFNDKKEWKKHTLKRYGYCDEYLDLPTTHLIKNMANMNVSVATYDDNTNTGIVLDRRKDIR
jgi:hypothetical protein